MSNQIYRMNEAEGIFFPAFDKHICDDSQMSMEGGQIERIWDSLTGSVKKFVSLEENDSFLVRITI